MNLDRLSDLFFENLRKILYPEDWIDIDLSFSKSELFTMLLVDRHQEVIMSRIAEYINVSMSTATGIVERLVQGGYLERERSESDRRIVVVRLTDKGKTLITEVKEVIFTYIRAITEALTEEEQELLGRILLKIMAVISRTNPEESKIAQEEKKVRKIEIK